MGNGLITVSILVGGMLFATWVTEKLIVGIINSIHSRG